MDQAEADALVLAYAPKVRKCAIRLGFTPGDADWDDLISDGLFGLWQARTTFDPKRGTLSARIAFRVHAAMVDGLRARGAWTSRTVPLTEADVDRIMSGDAPDDEATAHADADALAARASSADPRLSRVLTMVAAGAAPADIARAIGVSRPRVYQLLAAARDELTTVPA